MPQRRLVVRRYRAKLTDNQLELLSATIEAQSGISNHALTRLHRMYGPKKKQAPISRHHQGGSLPQE